MDPVIGITVNLKENRYQLALPYVEAVRKAGGLPVLLPSALGLEQHYVSICDGFIFSGGNDPKTEEWGTPTHPSAIPVEKERQVFELAMLRLLLKCPQVPVLGICLGMQWMGLLAGGTLEQDLPEPYASAHMDCEHIVRGSFGKGVVHSYHHQALVDSGSLDVIANSDDGVIEAVQDTKRHWYKGVQWHPERTVAPHLGQEIFNQLVQSCKLGTAK